MMGQFLKNKEEMQSLPQRTQRFRTQRLIITFWGLLNK